MNINLFHTTTLNHRLYIHSHLHSNFLRFFFVPGTGWKSSREVNRSSVRKSKNAIRDCMHFPKYNDALKKPTNQCTYISSCWCILFRRTCGCIKNQDKVSENFVKSNAHVRVLGGWFMGHLAADPIILKQLREFVSKLTVLGNCAFHLF